LQITFCWPFRLELRSTQNQALNSTLL